MKWSLGFEHLTRLSLTELNLSEAAIDNIAMPFIGQMTSLTELDLSYQHSLSDEGLQHLGNLFDLCTLDLSNWDSVYSSNDSSSRFTDAGLAGLLSMARRNYPERRPRKPALVKIKDDEDCSITQDCSPEEDDEEEEYSDEYSDYEDDYFCPSFIDLQGCSGHVGGSGANVKALMELGVGISLPTPVAAENCVRHCTAKKMAMLSYS